MAWDYGGDRGISGLPGAAAAQPRGTRRPTRRGSGGITAQIAITGGSWLMRRYITVTGLVLTATAVGLAVLVTRGQPGPPAHQRPAAAPPGRPPRHPAPGRPVRTPTALCSSTQGRAGYTRVASGAYDVLLEEWGSTAELCLRTTGGTDFRITRSDISQWTVGAYPNISTILGHDGMPVRISQAGNPASSWSVRTPGTTGSFDVAYDITIGTRRAATSWDHGGAEVMIWLATRGHPYELGRVVASHVRIGHAAYTVWVAPPSVTSVGQIAVTFVRERQTRAVTGLNLGRFIRLAASYGSFPTSEYLVRVQAGIEIIQGGKGFATTSFSYRPSPRRT